MCFMITMTSRGSTSKRSNSSSQASSSQSKKRKEDEMEGSEYLRRKHNFIKSTIRTDYQPDICKDYKETGFCGFGDSCKFLHDRTDYKHGWQLDQEFAKGEYKEEDDDKYLIKDGSDEDDDGGIPSFCPVCKERYKNPIVTKCKHYFCVDCAEKECSDKCFSCEKPTSGIFKNASKEINEKFAKSADCSDSSSGSEDEVSKRNKSNKEEDSEDSDESD